LKIFNPYNFQPIRVCKYPGELVVTHLFKKSFFSDLFEAKRTAIEAIGFLREAFPLLHEDQAADLRLIFNELLMNAVVHGNRSDTNKKVSIEINIDGEHVHSRVTDEGPGFDYRKTVMEWNAEDNLFDDHGRGVRLAYHMTDLFTFSEKGNVIEFYKRLVEE
jgi:serine/threonine-protein kinase RsbW